MGTRRLSGFSCDLILETAAQQRGTLPDSHQALPGFRDARSATRALL
jgi:hypothetical protein